MELLKATAELEHSLPPFFGPPVIVQPADEASVTVPAAIVVPACEVTI